MGLQSFAVRLLPKHNNLGPCTKEALAFKAPNSGCIVPDLLLFGAGGPCCCLQPWCSSGKEEGTGAALFPCILPVFGSPGGDNVQCHFL